MDALFTKILSDNAARAAKNCRLSNLSPNDLLEQLAQKIDEYWFHCIKCRAGDASGGACDTCSRDAALYQDAARAVRNLKTQSRPPPAPAPVPDTLGRCIG